MTDLFLEHLDRSGLVRGDAVDTDRVRRSSVSSLMELAESLTESSAADLHDRSASLFTHWASLSLSGGIHPCKEINCRLSRVEQLARYAALYSDCVFVRNEFSDYVAHPPDDGPRREAAFRRAFEDDLRVLSSLRPFITAGKIIPFTPPANYCRHCLARLSFGEDADKRLDGIEASLEREFFDKMRVEFYREDEIYTLHATGPEKLVDHGSLLWMSRGVPGALKDKPGLVRRADKGEHVQLSATTRRKLGLHRELASEVWRNIVAELSTSQSIGTTFLTERELHVDVLNELSEDTELERRNQLAMRHLTSLVPFAEDVPLARLLDLRRREEEAFVAYRSGLNRAIDEYRSEGAGFGEREAKAIYSDILAPRVSELERKVAHAKEDLIRGVASTAMGWAGAISFGLYAGFVPAGAAAAAAALGLAKVTADTISGALKTPGDSTVRNDEMYFLWRLSKLAK